MLWKLGENYKLFFIIYKIILLGETIKIIFVDNMIVCLENLNDFSKKLIKWMKVFDKVIEYKRYL